MVTPTTLVVHARGLLHIHILRIVRNVMFMAGAMAQEGGPPSSRSVRMDARRAAGCDSPTRVFNASYPPGEFMSGQAGRDASTTRSLQSSSSFTDPSTRSLLVHHRLPPPLTGMWSFYGYPGYPRSGAPPYAYPPLRSESYAYGWSHGSRKGRTCHL